MKLLGLTVNALSGLKRHQPLMKPSSIFSPCLSRLAHRCADGGFL